MIRCSIAAETAPSSIADGHGVAALQHAKEKGYTTIVRILEG